MCTWMYSLRNRLSRVMTERVVFVMGCGRSGTHWLGYILDSHSDIVATVEKPEIFDKATLMALDPNERARLLPVLQTLYRVEIKRAQPRFYADKSHPVLWFAEQLADIFPGALFLGIQRDPYATVSSMIRHKGVSDWTRNWRKFPVPNCFLGITHEDEEYYEDLSLAAKHTLRWKSHAERMAECRSILGSRMHFIEYEQLQLNTDRQLQKLARFLGVEKSFPPPEVKRSSLNRWREDLTEEQIADIAKIVGFPPPESIASK